MARIVRVRVQGELYGQQVLHTWSLLAAADVSTGLNNFCRGALNSLGLVASGGATATTFPAGTVYEAIQELTCSNFTFSNYYAFTPYDVGLFDAPAAAGTVGTGVGISAPPFEAVGFKGNRLRRDIRRFFKRIGGIPDGDIDADGTISGLTLTNAQALAALLPGTKVGTSGANTFDFTIITEKLQKVVDPETERVKYQDWQTEAGEPDEATALLNQTGFTAVEVQPFVTTQNSRKRGRGA